MLESVRNVFSETILRVDGILLFWGFKLSVTSSHTPAFISEKRTFVIQRTARRGASEKQKHVMFFFVFFSKVFDHAYPLTKRHGRDRFKSKSILWALRLDFPNNTSLNSMSTEKEEGGRRKKRKKENDPKRSCSLTKAPDSALCLLHNTETFC